MLSPPGAIPLALVPPFRVHGNDVIECGGCDVAAVAFDAFAWTRVERMEIISSFREKPFAMRTFAESPIRLTSSSSLPVSSLQHDALVYAAEQISAASRSDADADDTRPPSLLRQLSALLSLIKLSMTFDHSRLPAGGNCGWPIVGNDNFAAGGDGSTSSPESSAATAAATAGARFGVGLGGVYFGVDCIELIVAQTLACDCLTCVLCVCYV